MFDHAMSKTIIRFAIGILALLLGANCGDGAPSARDGGSRNDAGAKHDAGRAPAAKDAGRETTSKDAGMSLPPAVIGNACAADTDCEKGRCMFSERITKTPFPDGYCSGVCMTAADCGARGVCAPGFLGSPGSCYLGCDSDAQCARAGYRCRMSSSGVGTCLPGPTPLPDHVVGNACSSDTDCGGAKNTCRTAPAQAGFNYCTQNCAVDGDCGAGGLCISGVNGVPLSLGICFRSCVPPGDCRDGFTCRSISGFSNDARGACALNQSSDDAGTP
jgi:hypothetical protein